jgi:hypothetical protein
MPKAKPSQWGTGLVRSNVTIQMSKALLRKPEQLCHIRHEQITEHVRSLIVGLFFFNNSTNRQ